jgi:hypothetical protein
MLADLDGHCHGSQFSYDRAQAACVEPPGHVNMRGLDSTLIRRSTAADRRRGRAAGLRRPKPAASPEPWSPAPRAVYFSRGFSLGGCAAAQRDVMLAGAGYMGSPPFGCPGVDGTFIWTPSHDQRPRSLSTARLRSWLQSFLSAAWHVKRRSQESTNDLDGRRSVELLGEKSHNGHGKWLSADQRPSLTALSARMSARCPAMLWRSGSGRSVCA